MEKKSNKKERITKRAVPILFFFVIALLFFFKTLTVFGKPITELSKEELSDIEKYINDVNIEDGVGQLLMTGIPADIYNYSNNPYLVNIITTIGIGNFIINGYNCERASSSTLKKGNDIPLLIKQFTEYLQTLSKHSNLRIPLLVAADFESNQFSSIPYGLYQAPPALTLASTQNAELIRLTGNLVGFELFSVGVHIVLGPVLDIDQSIQGELNTTLTNRSFGSTPDIIYRAASNYIRGLQEGNVVVFGKHFPGHGSAKNNPHLYKIPSFDGSVAQLMKESLPYPEFNQYLDGIMTEHINIGFLESSAKPVTFSHAFVAEFLRNSNTIDIKGTSFKGLGYFNQIAITDDLSGMGSIIKYMDDNHLDFSTIAIQAFDAGHDLLVFSHLEVPGHPDRSRYARFTIQDLEAVKNALISHIKKSDKAEKRFRESLKRILILKTKVSKKYAPNFKGFPDSILYSWHSNLDLDLDEFTFLKERKYKNTACFLKNVYNNAMINKQLEFRVC